MVAAVGAVAVALVLGVVVSTWQAVRATRAEREQTLQRQAAERARVDAETMRERAEEAALVLRRNGYVSDMNVAHAALANDNLGLASQMVRKYLPKPGDADDF